MELNSSIPTVPVVVRACRMDVPSTQEYLHTISEDKTKLALLCIAGFCCFTTLFTYMYEISRLIKNKMPIIRRTRTVMLLSLYPVYSLLALLAILVPRAAPLLDLTANAYFSFTLWQFIQLMMLYYGGEKKMRDTFGDSDVSLRVPPICCVCCCLKPFKMTEKAVLKLKLAAAQFLIFRPVLLLISMILWVEDKYEHKDTQTGKMNPFKSSSTYIALANMVTTLIAMYALIIIFRASRKRLSRYHIQGKFIVFQMVMIFGSLQDAILTQTANFNLLECSEELPAKSWALEIHHFLMVGEMFAFSMAALVVYWRYIHSNIPLIIDADSAANGSSYNGVETTEAQPDDYGYADNEEASLNPAAHHA